MNKYDNVSERKDNVMTGKNRANMGGGFATEMWMLCGLFVVGIGMGLFGEVMKRRNEVWVGSGEVEFSGEMRVVCDGPGSCDWRFVKSEVR